MARFGEEGMKRMTCPMCEQVFVNSRKLNRHKRTCPAKDDD
jgi:uncharacterized C2H2 Zn-finger protein